MNSSPLRYVLHNFLILVGNSTCQHNPLVLCHPGWMDVLSVHVDLGITAHYITDDWEMKKVMIGCLPIVGHHTSGKIAEMLLQQLDKFHLRHAVTAVIHDNASNMLALPIEFPGIRCLAHTLNLVVQEVLLPVKEMLDKVRKVVSSYFCHHICGGEALQEVGFAHPTTD